MYIHEDSIPMFRGSNAPPAAKWTADIIKCDGSKLLTGICCNPDLTAYFQHYRGGRTQICLEHNCPHCEAGNPQKQIGYMPILLSNNQGRGFLEIPYSGFQFFERHLHNHGTCERHVIKVSRVGGNKYGKVQVAFCGRCQDDLKLPSFPRTRDWLFQLWGITIGNPGASDETGSNSHLSEKTTPLIFRENAG